MAEKVEAAGITVFTGFAAAEFFFDGDRVSGVRTDDKGVDKNGQPKANFEPGYDLRSKITILRGGLAWFVHQTNHRAIRLEDPNHAQVYGVGIKELWEVPAGRVAQGRSHLHLGYPLTTKEYGGAWIYGISDTLLSVGYVTGLDYRGPAHRSAPCFQSFKRASSPARHSRRRQDDSLRREESCPMAVDGTPCHGFSATAG